MREGGKGSVSTGESEKGGREHARSEHEAVLHGRDHKEVDLASSDGVGHLEVRLDGEIGALRTRLGRYVDRHEVGSRLGIFVKESGINSSEPRHIQTKKNKKKSRKC